MRETTNFQVKPTKLSRKVVFSGSAFDLDRVVFISEPYMENKMSYAFYIVFSYNDTTLPNHVINLKMPYTKRTECQVAQRELTRAWAKVGEFSEDLLTEETPEVEYNSNLPSRWNAFEVGAQTSE